MVCFGGFSPPTQSNWARAAGPSEVREINLDGLKKILQRDGKDTRPLLVNFWATWCDPCREEIPRFIELQNKYGERGLQIIGISMDDSPQPVRDFYHEFKMNYPVALGGAKTGDLYGGVLGLPIAFVIDREGRICTKHIGATDISVFEREITAML